MKAKSLMVLGTASGVGKSFITAGLCRVFSDAGYKVAPFKAQNMSNNSFVTVEGGEIGRAQAVQAECARVRPHTDMNPVLLKPASDNGSQVVIQGRAIGHFKARDYYAQKQKIQEAVRESYERLAATYDVLVMEGAGSCAEVNLKENDFVNLNMAEMAEAACLLVADIDRGGVFASLIGTLELLEPHERERIKGFVINKFRGDPTLFDSGITFLEKKTNKKVLGVLPYEREIWIEEEDSLMFEKAQGSVDPESILDIAVVLLPHLSNFTDFDALRYQPGVRLRFLKRTQELGSPDLVILPGTKATVSDLLYLREKGWEETLQDYKARGGCLLGICGGYQMMGEWIRDPEQVETQKAATKGFGFFSMTTEFEKEKVLRQVQETISCRLLDQPLQAELKGYEIHMGKSFHHEEVHAFGPWGASHLEGKIMGTYLHGLFDSEEFTDSFLQALRQATGKPNLVSGSQISLVERKEQNYSQLASMLQRHLNLESLAF